MASVFTKILRGEIPGKIIAQDEKFFAILDIKPMNPGHILVVPKQETDYLFDLDDEQYLQLFVFCKKLAPALKKATGAKRIGLAVEGFGVPHVHVHLVPINTLNEMNPERARDASAEELEEMYAKIMAAVRESGQFV